MAHYKDVSFQGSRKTYEGTGATLFAPACHKYYTVYGQFCSKNWLSAQLAKKGGAHSGAGVTIAAGSEVEYNLLEGITNVTPFVITKQKIRYDMKNNHDAPCNLTIYEVRPKGLLPDKIDAVAAAEMTTMPEILFRSVLEGLADKFQTTAFDASNAANPNVGALHTAANAGSGAADTQIPDHVNDYSNNNSVLPPEMSLLPPITIFDSTLFGQLFTVEKVTDFYLRPGDKLTYIMEGPRVEFMDGIEPYLGAETIAHEFNKFALFQLMGDPAHQTAYNMPGSAGATSLPHHPTTWNMTADKQAWHGVHSAAAALDVFWWRETEFDVFDATLMEPLSNIVMDGAFNYNDMLDISIQANADLN